MKFMFVVQGEGRGHMTQAISLRNILVKHGHEVVHVLVGKSARREVPNFFFEKIQTPVDLYESPNFVTDKSNVKIQLGRTITYNIRRAGHYFKSMKFIDSIIKSKQPDVIVNFYELLFGMYFRFYKPNAKHICIGHQYLLKHPDFTFPEGWKRDKALMDVNTNTASYGACKYLALSFRHMRDVPEKKITVVPPLLRPEVKQLKPVNEGFILGYMLNAGYSTQIEEWHKNNPTVKAHFFWDKKDAPEDLQVNPNLAFHRLDDVKFLDYMSRCAGYASTAGFESICEAMYMGKPIMMVPTTGHFEQACNGVDAKLAGGGVPNDKFDLSVLVDYIPKHKDITGVFRAWADSSEEIFIRELTNV
jgi:uncharacterized protein (TIGR00661 family)